MFEGAGSPLPTVVTRAQPLPGSVFSFSGAGKKVDTADYSPRTDQVDISDQALSQSQTEDGRGNVADEEVELVREQLREIKQQMQDLAGSDSLIKGVVKGARQQMKELDEMFHDEDRIPPGLLTVLRQMSEFPRPKKDGAYSQLA